MASLWRDEWELQPKHASTDALQRWRNLCGVVKNPKRRFRFTANLSKRYEAAEMRQTNKVFPPHLMLNFVINEYEHGSEILKPDLILPYFENCFSVFLFRYQILSVTIFLRGEIGDCRLMF